MAAAIIATGWIMVPASLSAAPSTGVTVPGRCQYSGPVIRARQQTVLVLCDTVMIERDDAQAIVDFGQKSWGSKARITGELFDGRLAISAVAITGASPVAASGSCQFDYRPAGSLSGVRCLLKTGSRWFAVNFVASRL